MLVAIVARDPVALPHADDLVRLPELGARQQGFVYPQIAEFFGDKVSHLAGLAGKSPGFVEHVLLHPAYREICDHVLRPNCSDYQLNIAHGS